MWGVSHMPVDWNVGSRFCKPIFVHPAFSETLLGTCCCARGGGCRGRGHGDKRWNLALARLRVFSCYLVGGELSLWQKPRSSPRSQFHSTVVSTEASRKDDIEEGDTVCLQPGVGLY